MKTMSIALLAGLMSSTVLAESANLNRTYIDGNIGGGRASVRVGEQSFQFHSKEFSANGALKLSENTFASLSFATSRIDDEDQASRNYMELDAETFNYTAMLGAAMPFGQSSDVVVQLGVNKFYQKNRFRSSLGYIFGSPRFKTVTDQTSLAWSVGTRTLFETYRSELEFIVSGFKNRTTFTLGGPVHLTPNLGLNLAYHYSRTSGSVNRGSGGMLALGLRYQF